MDKKTLLGFVVLALVFVGFAYLNGKELGKMTLIPRAVGDPWRYDSNGKKLSDTDYNAQAATIKAQTSISNPTRLMESSSVDWYCAGYNVGVRNIKRTSSLTAAYRLYKLENAALATADWSKVKVVAIDEYGNRYESSELIDGVVGIDFDYSKVAAPTW